MGVSVSQLNRIARAVTGQTLQGLIARRITEAACRDLVFTPTPVSGIAESLGFSDPAYFNRFFRKQTGITPGAYRARERGRLVTS
jgi:AraC family transcriptional activator of pobA